MTMFSHKKRHIGAAVAVALGCAVVLGACTSGADTAAARATETKEPTVVSRSNTEPTIEATGAPESTPAIQPIPTVANVPSATFDAESQTLAYYRGVMATAVDPRRDRTNAVRDLQDQDGPLSTFLEDFATRLIERNRYLDDEDDRARVEIVIGSMGPRSFASAERPEFDRLDLIAVDFCVQNSGIWRDLNTDAVVSETRAEPFVGTIWVSQQGTIWALTEHVPYQPCAFGH